MLGTHGSGLTRRVFYGWWIVASGAVTMGMAGGLFFLGFGFFFEPMRQTFGWSRTLLSAAFALTRVEGGMLAPLEGYLIQRFGPRKVMTVSFVFFGVGFILLSRVNSVLTFYLAFIVLALGAGSAGFSGVMAAINNWFRRKRARAVGFAMLGMGIGGVVFPPILAFSIETFGWRDTAMAAGIFVMVVGIPISRVVRFNPEPYGYLPDGEKPAKQKVVELSVAQAQNAAQVEYDFTVREALKTKAFWLMSTGHSLALLVISVISLHQVPYLESDLGFSKATAASVVIVLTGASMFGQVLGGFLGDRFAKQYLAATTLLGHSVGLFLLAIADSYPEVLLSAVIQGLAWGVRTPVLVSMRGDYFGRKSFAMIMGLSQTIMMIGMVIGPILTGYFADNYSYSLGFKIIAVGALPGFFMFIFLRKPKPVTAENSTSRSITRA